MYIYYSVMGSFFIHSSIHSSIQQIFTKYLLCARNRGYIGDSEKFLPSKSSQSKTGIHTSKQIITTWYDKCCELGRDGLGYEIQKGTELNLSEGSRKAF